MKPLQYRAEWYIPNQVIFMAVWGDSSKEAMRSYLTMLNTMITESFAQSAASGKEYGASHLVHVIADFTHIGKQVTVLDMAQVLKTFTPHPNIGWAITYGAMHPIRRMITDIGRQMMKLRQRSFDTFDQAIAFLHEIDETLEWSKTDEAALDRVRPTFEEIQA